MEVWHRLERCTRLLVLLSTCLRAESSSFANLVLRFVVMRQTVMWRLRDLSPCLVSVFEVMFAPLPRFHRLGCVCAWFYVLSSSSWLIKLVMVLLHGAFGSF